MADIASISLRVDTDELQRGNSELDKFQQKATSAAGAADGFNASGKETAKVSKEIAQEVADTHRRVSEYAAGLAKSQSETKASSQATAQQRQELRDLLTQINPVTAAFERLDNIESKLSKFNAKGLVEPDTFAEASKTIQETRAQLERAATARTEEGKAAAAAAQQERAAIASKSAFLAKLQEQNALYKASASDAAAYRAAQLGISQEAAPLIASMRQQEEAVRREADQKRAAAIATRGLKESIKEMEAAERSAAQATERAQSQRTAFIQKLKDQVATQSLSREELLRYRAAQLGVSSSADVYIKKIATASAETHKFSLQSSAARRELGVMLGELARGNLGALRGSSITLANRSGLLDQLMSPQMLIVGGVLGIITASLYGLYHAYDVAEQQSQAFSKAVIISGGVSGQSSSSLRNLAYNIGQATGNYGAAAEAVTKLAAKSVSSVVDFRRSGEAIVNYSRYSGESIDSLVEQFARLSDDPRGGVEALNKKYHFLTTATYQQISALVEQGQQTDAVKTATDALSGSMNSRAQEIKESMGTLPRLFDEISSAAKRMWDEIMSIGRDPSQAEQMAAAELRLKSAREMARRLEIQGKSVPQKYQDIIKQSEAEIAGIKKATEEKKNQRKVEEDGIKAQQTMNRLTEWSLSPAEKRKREERELNEAIEANRKAHEKDAQVQIWGAEQIAKARKGIEEKYKDHKTPKGAKYQTPAGDKAEDSAQADLLALQVQLEVLRQHTGLNDKISQQRKDLWKSQAQFTVLEQAADNRKLSAQEKSLLSSKGEVLASKERLAVIGDQIVQQERLNKLQDASTKYVIQMSEKRDALRESAGLSGRQTQRKLEEAQLRQGWQTQGGNLNDQGYKDQLQAMRDYYAEEDKLRGNWQDGARAGWSEYLDSANNTYSAMSSIANSTLTGMADMLTSLTITGKASFRSFTTSILKMIADVINKLLVAYTVQAALGWISAGASAGAGSANNAFSGGAYSGLTFDSGGYTGDGGKYEPAGVVHRGEFVMTKEATQRIGVDNLYDMMHRSQGYANGGLVGNTVTGTAPMHGLRGGGVTVDLSGMTIVTQGGQQQSQNATANNELVSRAVRNEVIGIVSEQLEKALGQSGRITNFVTSKIGR